MPRVLQGVDQLGHHGVRAQGEGCLAALAGQACLHLSVGLGVGAVQGIDVGPKGAMDVLAKAAGDGGRSSGRSG